MHSSNLMMETCETEAVWDAGKTQFFQFEEDFIEDNVRCIPMVVRFKLDACGIKLKLEEWCKFTVEERNVLVEKKCTTANDIALYKRYLQQLVLAKTGNIATDLAVEKYPAWNNKEYVFEMLYQKALQSGIHISVAQWQRLGNLQRFALIKLSRQSHESKNLPKALKEFGLTA
jgi:hypothetical protein